MFTYQIPATQSFIAEAGPATQVAPVAPSGYGITPLPGKHPRWLLTASGTLDPAKKLYPGVLFAPGTGATSVGSPVLPSTGNAALEFTDIPSVDFIANANVRETDVKYVFLINGVAWMANCSLQRHVTALTGKIGQIDIGNWTPVADINAGPMIANRKHHVRIVHAFNLTAKTYQMVSYMCDGVVLPIPGVPQPMTECNWTATAQGLAYDQQQLGLNPEGGPVELVVENIKHRYW